jgi:NADH-quinone oxidoreductase subunit K
MLFLFILYINNRVSVLFILFAISSANILGFIYVFVILTLAAAESAIGLGLLVVSFRLNGTISFSSYQRLKG